MPCTGDRYILLQADKKTKDESYEHFRARGTVTNLNRMRGQTGNGGGLPLEGLWAKNWMMRKRCTGSPRGEKGKSKAPRWKWTWVVWSKEGHCGGTTVNENQEEQTASGKTRRRQVGKVWQVPGKIWDANCKEMPLESLKQQRNMNWFLFKTSTLKVIKMNTY